MVIQVPRVVADLVDIRRDDFCQSIIFLQVDRQIARDLLPNFDQRFGIFLAVDRDAHDISTGIHEVVYLPHRGVNIRRLCGRHALHGNRRITADESITDGNGTRRIADDIEFCFRGHAGIVVLSRRLYMNRCQRRAFCQDLI